MIDMSRKGAVVFEYGNNIRQKAFDAGLKEAFEFPGFVQKYIRPMFCEGRGPFRWTSLVGDPEDIRKIDELVLDTFPHNSDLGRWIEKAREHVKFKGSLPESAGSAMERGLSSEDSSIQWSEMESSPARFGLD